MMPGELVSGSPGDTLQYLSQLEMVARKLKHQLIKQKQVRWTQQGTGGSVEPLLITTLVSCLQDDRLHPSENKGYKAQGESEC